MLLCNLIMSSRFVVLPRFGLSIPIKIGMSHASSMLFESLLTLKLRPSTFQDKKRELARTLLPETRIEFRKGKGFWDSGRHIQRQF